MNQTLRQEGGHVCEPEWFHKGQKISEFIFLGFNPSQKQTFF
mgnify:CR=1 FL=1